MVAKFLDDVYNGLCDDNFTLDVPQDLARALGMLQPQEEMSLAEPTKTQAAALSILPDPEESVAVIVDAKKSLVGSGATDVQATEVDGHKVFYTVENWNHSLAKQQPPTKAMSEDGKPKQSKKRLAREQSAGSQAWDAPALRREEFGFRSLGHARMPVTRNVDNSQCRFNKTVTDAGLAQATSEELMNSLAENIGGFVAACGPAHATQWSANTALKYNAVISDPNNLFRMKLPKEKIVAFMAVGIE